MSTQNWNKKFASWSCTSSLSLSPFFPSLFLANNRSGRLSQVWKAVSPLSEGGTAMGSHCKVALPAHCKCTQSWQLKHTERNSGRSDKNGSERYDIIKIKIIIIMMRWGGRRREWESERQRATSKKMYYKMKCNQVWRQAAHTDAKAYTRRESERERERGR